jgi:hypothetical protein
MGIFGILGLLVDLLIFLFLYFLAFGKRGLFVFYLMFFSGFLTFVFGMEFILIFFEIVRLSVSVNVIYIDDVDTRVVYMLHSVDINHDSLFYQTIIVRWWCVCV